MRRTLPQALRMPALALAALVTAGAVGAAVVVGGGFSSSSASTPQTAAPPSPVPRSVPAAPASRSRPPLPVQPLRKVVAPDLMLTTKAPLTPAQVHRLLALRGVTGGTVLATGTVRVGGRPVSATGVDPSAFRAFTPRETARSDALWAVIARGELSASYAAK